MLIDWKKDYQNDFVCPHCKTNSMVFLVFEKTKNNINAARFNCENCNKSCRTEYILQSRQIPDPINFGVFWHSNRRIPDFICPDPNCGEENIYFYGIAKDVNKKRFQCKTCLKRYSESVELSLTSISRKSKKSPPIKPFNWLDEIWDLREINPNFDRRDNAYTANFSDVIPSYFMDEVKKYVYHLSKSENSMSTIQSKLSSLRFFSRYLVKANVPSFNHINRDLIFNYLAQEQKVTKNRLGGLREFFTIGTNKNWFNIDPDIIRDVDYPKRYVSNPDPISNIVREQIEQNLYRLPDPIARMWLIGYFSAMRPSELALLKQDCLVQEGQNWKLVWQRKKTNDYHQIPITITISKIVQEQQKYIQNLWGDNWEYLFCHYQNLSSTDPAQPKLEPIKKVIPNQGSNPLSTGIRALIKAIDIRDENGQLAKFQSKLFRPTRLTELFQEGHELSVVSAWAGHKHLMTTSTYYTEVSCNLMAKEAEHIQQALVNSDGYRISYESFPKSFWDNPIAHKLEVGATHINTPIYGYCGLPLDQDCHKFRACYTCRSFVATIEKLPEYMNTLNELRSKEATAMSAGHEVLVEQYGKQAEQLDKIIASLQPEAA